MTKEARYVVKEDASTSLSFMVCDTSVEGHYCIAESQSKADADLIAQTLNSRGELLQELKAIVQALKDFGPPSNASAQDVYAWLESTSPFVDDDTIIDP